MADAIERKEQLGGRIGTCLLEIGAISEDLLVQALADQLEVPAAEGEDLLDIDPEILRLLPAELAIRAEAIPFRLLGSRLDVALLGIRDLPLHDEIAFVLGKGLNLHIANEVRIHEGLERYYGKRCSVRFRNLLRQLDRQQSTPPLAPPPPSPGISLSLGSDSRPAGITLAEGSAVTRILSIPPAVIQSRSIPLSEEERAILISSSPGDSGEPASAPQPLDAPGQLLDRLNSDLLKADGAEEVARALLDSVSPFFVRTVLLRVRRGRVDGWAGRGPRLDGERISALRVPFNGNSVFRDVSSGDEGLFVGPLPDLAPHVELVSLWEGELETECILARIAIRGRAVGLLYADRGRFGLSGADAGVVLQAASHTALALERCILKKRLPH